MGVEGVKGGEGVEGMSGGEILESPARRRWRRVGLWGGPLAALAVAWLLPAEYLTLSGEPAALSAAGRATAALGAWMAVWWMTEAVPVYATALLPLALLPLLGAGSGREAAAPYGNETIYLFLGGFLLALAMQRWGLDRRIAFGALRVLGARADRLVLGIMCVTAFLSMWVSNTATSLTMYPIALSVLALARHGVPAQAYRNFAQALLLGVAYAATIGGMATVIGTPPNLFMASYARGELGIEIGFARWMLFGVPVALLFLPLTWRLLLRLFPVRQLGISGVEDMAARELRGMGALSRAEKTVIAAFCLAAGVWIFRPLLSGIEVAGVRPLAGITDSGVAILAALLLFVSPSGVRGRAVLDWETAKKLPFGLLLLFGGGLSLAAAIERNGVGQFLGGQMAALQGVPLWVFLVVAMLGVVFLGELLSNTAMAATLIPICAALAVAMGWDPLEVLVPIALASSCGFMLPVATPPNAVVYGSGEVDAQAMVRAGFWLNFIGVGIVLGVVWALGRWVF